MYRCIEPSSAQHTKRVIYDAAEDMSIDSFLNKYARIGRTRKIYGGKQGGK